MKIEELARMHVDEIAYRIGHHGPVESVLADEAADLADTMRQLTHDLVRVLLAVEWSGHRGRCPQCFASRPYDGEAGPKPRAHEPDCALDAALRKAGVR